MNFLSIFDIIQPAKILLLPSKHEIIIVPSNHSFFQYCVSNIGLFIAVAIVWRTITIWEAIQKRSHKGAVNQSTKLMQNWSKEIKSDTVCYRKVERVINKWGAKEKSQILLSQYWKNYHFERATKIILHFDGSNIFVDCMWVFIIFHINILQFQKVNKTYYKTYLEMFFPFFSRIESSCFRCYFKSIENNYI